MIALGSDHAGLPLKKGAVELLSWLKEQNALLALASSTKRSLVIQELTDAGLLDYFSVITGGDQISHSKPDPEIYLKACEKLGIDPKEAYAVEDSYNGIRSAFSAGMKPLMVPDLLPPTGEMEEKAHRIFDDLLEVRDFLAGK